MYRTAERFTQANVFSGRMKIGCSFRSIQPFGTQFKFYTEFSM